jgi:hypothetical protein
VKPNSSNKELRATYTLLIERLQEHYTQKVIDKEKMGREEGKNAEREKASARIYAATAQKRKPRARRESREGSAANGRDYSAQRDTTSRGRPARYRERATWASGQEHSGDGKLLETVNFALIARK